MLIKWNPKIMMYKTQKDKVKNFTKLSYQCQVLKKVLDLLIRKRGGNKIKLRGYNNLLDFYSFKYDVYLKYKRGILLHYATLHTDTV